MTPNHIRKLKKSDKIVQKRSTWQPYNKAPSTICLARAIVVALATHNRDKLQDIFRERLSEDEVKEIKYRRQIKKS